MTKTGMVQKSLVSGNSCHCHSHMLWAEIQPNALFPGFPLKARGNDKPVLPSSEPYRKTLKEDAWRSRKGFTLIEVMAALVILAVLVAAALPKYIDLSTTAISKAIDVGVAELNARENFTWAGAKIAPPGWTQDALPADTNLGTEYAWSAGPTTNGGTLSFQSSTNVVLTRTVSTDTSPGKWARQ